jgi:hypothetical protein
MATVTPNYNWPVPQSTDFVKDGADSIKDLGDAIDATVFGLVGGTALTLISKTTIGAAVASVNVTGAFSSSYSRYKIFITGSGTTTADVNLALKLGASTTGYYWGGPGISFGGGTTSIAGSNQASFNNIGFGKIDRLNMDLELIDPGVASFTKIFGVRNDSTSAKVYGGQHEVATAFTDFTITPSSGTMTGGVIYLFGYEV